MHGKRLYFLYIGVLLIGFATVLYSALSPSPIKSTTSAVDYVRHMSDLNTPNIVRDSFLNTVSIYRKYNNEEERHPMFSGNSLNSPERVSAILHPFIESMFQSSDTDIDVLEHDVSGDEVHRLYEPLRTGSGYIRTDIIMKMLHSGRTVDRAFQYEILNEVIKNPKDVFFLEYISLEYSEFPKRFIVATAYVLGFGTLLIPTLTTLAIIFRSW
jgi:hypothetical protein